MDFATSLNNLLRDLSDQFLCCEICYEKFDCGARKPVVLPCHHSFCRDCMHQLLQQQRSTCSKCRASVLPSIPLQVDFTRIQLMDLMQRHASGKDDPQKNGTHNRRFVWRGRLKFLSDKEGQVTNHLLKAWMSVGIDDPQLNTQDWPQTMHMQLLPQYILKDLIKQVKDSRSLSFHFPQNESVKNLHRLILQGLIGSAYFPTTSQTLLLLYDRQKKTLVGALPNNSVAFAQGLRKALQRCIPGARVKWAPLQPKQASILQKTLAASSNQAMLAAPSSGQNQRSSGLRFRQDSPLPSESGRDDDFPLLQLPSWH